MSAAVTSATSGGTFANDATVGTIDWDTPSNASASDNTRASSVLLITEVTKYLKATNFGFAIPTGSTIRGIVVEVEKSSVTGVTIEDNSVKIVKGGTISGDDKAEAGAWSDTDAYSTYGSATDLWGVTWTAEDINAATFGVVVAADATAAGTARIDHIRITVHYTDLQASSMHNFPLIGYSTVVGSANTLQFLGYNILASISLNTLNLGVVRTGSQTLTLSIGLYSLTGSTLSLANSGSVSSGSAGVEKSGYLSISTFSATQNITPGGWFWGVVFATSSNSAFRLYGGVNINPANAFPGGFIGGAMTDSTNALPSSYETSNLNITGQSAFPVPYLIISA